MEGGERRGVGERGEERESELREDLNVSGREDLHLKRARVREDFPAPVRPTIPGGQGDIGFLGARVI